MWSVHPIGWSPARHIRWVRPGRAVRQFRRHVFEAHARQIELCVFDQSGRREIARYELPEWTNEVWHGYLPDAQPGLLYGFRVHGDYAPERGHRFNPHKLLLDPYGKRISGQLHWTNALFGYRIGAGRTDLTMDRRDSAPAMPKSVVTDDHFSWGADRKPRTPSIRIP